MSLEFFKKMDGYNIYRNFNEEYFKGNLFDDVILSNSELSLFKRYKKSANKRNYSFSISNQTFRRIIRSDCHYCGSSPATVHKNITYNGIDRLDNKFGYLPSNLIPCCKICNYAKRDLTVEDFINWTKRFVKQNYPLLEESVTEDENNFRIHTLMKKSGLFEAKPIEQEVYEGILNSKKSAKYSQFYSKEFYQKLNKDKVFRKEMVEAGIAGMRKRFPKYSTLFENPEDYSKFEKLEKSTIEVLCSEYHKFTKKVYRIAKSKGLL